MASVAKIQWEQKVMEKESEKRMSEIEGRTLSMWRELKTWSEQVQYVLQVIIMCSSTLNTAHWSALFK